MRFQKKQQPFVRLYPILFQEPKKRCILNEYTAVFLCRRHMFCARAALHSAAWVTDWGTLGTKWGFLPWESTSRCHRVVTQGECSCYPTWMKRYPAWVQLFPRRGRGLGAAPLIGVDVPAPGRGLRFRRVGIR